jgi:hypothetical protein
MYYYFMHNREEFLAHYHKRSNVETAFSMIKAKFGDAVQSKSHIGQLNEVPCKVLCHNLCVIIQAIHESGIDPTFCAKPGIGRKFPECSLQPRFGKAKIEQRADSTCALPRRDPLRLAHARRAPCVACGSLGSP